MIYAVKKHNSLEKGWVAFDTGSEQWVQPAVVPTVTSDLAQAERILAKVAPEWMCEIVLVQITYRSIK